MRSLIALAPLALLAACGDGNGDAADAPVVNAAPVVGAPAPAGKAWIDVVERTAEGGYRQGNPNAPVKLVEYGSRSCPACGNFAATGVEPLRQKYVASGQVSYEFRDYIIHPQDLGIALLGHCVAPETFFPMLDAMYANQPAFFARQEQLQPQQIAQIQQLSPPQAAPQWAEALGYVEFVKQRGIPDAQARACLADPKKLEAISKTFQAGVERGVNQTPTFYVGDRKVVGSWAEVESALRAAGAR